MVCCMHDNQQQKKIIKFLFTTFKGSQKLLYKYYINEFYYSRAMGISVTFCYFHFSSCDNCRFKGIIHFVLIFF